VERLTLDRAVAGAAPQEGLRDGSAQPADLHAAGAVGIELDRFAVEHAVCAGHGAPRADRTGGEDTDRLVGEVDPESHGSRVMAHLSWLVTPGANWTRVAKAISAAR